MAASCDVIVFLLQVRLHKAELIFHTDWFYCTLTSAAITLKSYHHEAVLEDSP